MSMMMMIWMIRNRPLVVVGVVVGSGNPPVIDDGVPQIAFQAQLSGGKARGRGETHTF